MNDKEMSSRQKLARQNENADIMRDYNAAFIDGVNRWALDGGKGSMFEAIKGQMIAKGVVK